jgi:hypothetical protein
MRDERAAGYPGKMTFPDSGPARTASTRRTSDQRSDPKTLPTVEDAVGERLRAAYTQIMRDPIPQRFVELLQRLDGRTEDRA